VKFGFVDTTFGGARASADIAREAEQAGWDGFFVGEAVWHYDPWISLTAAAMCTSRIRLGTLVVQMPRHTPWKLSSEIASLDNLSNGRLILGVGPGVYYYGYGSFKDEITDKKIRGELMDEGVDLLTLLQLGKPFKYEGAHFHVDQTGMEEKYSPARPVQKPRVPIWMVGAWPRMKSMRRVLKCDGLLPNKMDPEGKLVDVQPEDLRQMKEYIQANRALDTPFDLIAEGQTHGLDENEIATKLRPWMEAGATWWIETPYGLPEEQAIARMRQGPPRLE
jgi:hypothetical protein